MINTLSRFNYFDFNKMLIENYSYIGLSELESMILLKIASEIEKNSNLSLLKLQKETSLTKEELDKVFSNLYSNDFLAIEYIENDGKVEEKYTIYPTYQKIYESLENRFSSEKIVRLIEDGFNRTLSSSDLVTVSEFKYSFNEVKYAISICLQNNVSNINYLKRVLETNAK